MKLISPGAVRFLVLSVLPVQHMFALRLGSLSELLQTWHASKARSIGRFPGSSLTFSKLNRKGRCKFSGTSISSASGNDSLEAKGIEIIDISLIASKEFIIYE